ncbi:MAG: hypothetical protein AAF927_02795 [Bacteroidota bacterium]
MNRYEQAKSYPIPPIRMNGNMVRVTEDSIRPNSVGEVIFEGVRYKAISRAGEIPASCLAKVIRVTYEHVEIVRPEVYYLDDDNVVPLDPPHKVTRNRPRSLKFSYGNRKIRFPYER